MQTNAGEQKFINLRQKHSILLQLCVKIISKIYIVKSSIPNTHVKEDIRLYIKYALQRLRVAAIVSQAPSKITVQILYLKDVDKYNLRRRRAI